MRSLVLSAALLLAGFSSAQAQEADINLRTPAIQAIQDRMAARFTEVMGMPPMQYLKRWRLCMAARLLCGERSSLMRANASSDSAMMRARSAMRGEILGYRKL